MVIGPGCGLNPKDTVPPVYRIEIDFQDPLLAPQEFHKEGIIGLDDFPEEASLGPEKQGPGGLHGNGARSTNISVHDHISHCPVYLGKIKAPVGSEPLVLTCKDGSPEMRGYLVEGTPRV
jgi:hypothetical protein